MGHVKLHNFKILFLSKLTIAKLRWNHTRYPFEHFGKIVGIRVADQDAHVLHIHLPVLKQLLGLAHAEMGEVGGEILVKALLEQFAEIGVRVIHSPGRVLHVMAATEGEQVLGFIVLIPYKDMVMADYLAVSSKVRSRGTGSYIMQNVCRQYKDKKIVLLIERLDDKAENKEQRIARRKFYLKNGFTSSDIFITGASGEMEIMNFGEKVSEEAYIDLQKYALGTVMFRLSKIKVAEKTPHKKREEADQG